MKKIYMSPEMEIVEMKNHQMLLAGSALGLGDPGSANNAEAPLFMDDELLGWDVSPNVPDFPGIEY
jgi:hypothetical protein